MSLQTKVAIIAGAGSGFGEAIAHKFGREDARSAACQPIRFGTSRPRSCPGIAPVSYVAGRWRRQAREALYQRHGARRTGGTLPGAVTLHHAHDGLRDTEMNLAHDDVCRIILARQPRP